MFIQEVCKENGENVDCLFDFDVPDEVLCNIPLPEAEVQQTEKTARSVLSGCVFNNCSINIESSA